MNINAKGVFLGCKYAIPALRRAGGGSIINTASFVAIVGAATPQVAYTASKGAVLSMTRELAVIHARENIRVNALCPGPLNTELLMKLLDTDEKKQRRLVHIPMGRFGEAKEMANAALWLASDESSFTTGATFMVDGGLTSAYVTPLVTTLLSPATGESIGEVPTQGPSEVDQAVGKAKSAFGEWSRASVRERRDVLRRVADLVRRDQERLAALESTQHRQANLGWRGARSEPLPPPSTSTPAPSTSSVARPSPATPQGTLLTWRQPLGVCAAIVPWNFPMVIAGWKVAPALAMGNTVVLKPAEITPLSALALAELALEAGLPEGALAVVTGRGSLVGEALASHPDVAKVSFTGSTEVGTRIMELAAPTIKRISLELGGKSANVIFADADLDVCLPSSLWSVYDNAGQDCCARSRLIVERSIYDEVLERFVAAAEAIRLGDPAHEETEMGPLITAAHRERVAGYLDIGRDEGAQVVTGGKVQDGPGNYLTPAVLTEVDSQDAGHARRNLRSGRGGDSL